MLVRESNMGLFKKKNPQDAFDPDVFTITGPIKEAFDAMGRSEQ